ncbi:sacsin N-terminal ATP-binding-like domain-containing protein [Aureispira sp. CCB-QB1]|uniref:sacsin N-terminal ATP-binding-like domain-containing protein n=1 Tax=Aureispira sp. CCB-QB1 TaxID=1313421 RepID=UPI0018CC0E43|nr:DUF3883 domain-containing protein [Aureispira sp. CCB-QB1]
MKIKNIRQYRKYYKAIVRDAKDNRDENFIGHSILSGDKEIKGYFEIAHADKKDIKGFLTGFLDMAKDSQAVYEFLQNAVDAESSLFYMFYGPDGEDGEYFLAINNGRQFDFEGVRSILNIGQSTKSNEDKHNIGKFGIGFKLVHRLVGETSGIDELINQNYGPILFSWKNFQLKQLMDLTKVEDINFSPLDGENIQEEIKRKEDDFAKHEWKDNDFAWFFKILLTNYPCQPRDLSKNYHYQETNQLFSDGEVLKMVSWLNKIDTDNGLNLRDIEEGSIFFLKLGKDKANILLEDKLDEGIEFSLTFLNKIGQHHKKNEILNEVQINEDTIKPASIIIEDVFEINPIDHQNDYEYIMSDVKGVDKTPIEILFGYYPLSSKEHIKELPNFYLYFPLSDEKYGLNFVIHSNAFYNASQRTSLYYTEGKKDEEKAKEDYGRNERLFIIFTEHLIKRLDGYKTTNKEKFLDIYVAILTSNSVFKDGKIFQPLYLPLLSYIKENIPVQGEQEYAKDVSCVRINNTGFDILPIDFGVENIQWFLWNAGDKEHENIVKDADNQYKLKIEKWDICKLISNTKDVTKIDEWLANNTEIIPEFIKLIESQWKNEQSSEFKEIFKNIKFIKGKDKLYSLNDIVENKSIILNHNRIVPIRAELEKLGFIITNQNFEDFIFLNSFIKNIDGLEYIRGGSFLFQRLQNLSANNISTSKHSESEVDALIKYSIKNQEKIFSFLKIVAINDGGYELMYQDEINNYYLSLDDVSYVKLYSYIEKNYPSVFNRIPQSIYKSYTFEDLRLIGLKIPFEIYTSLLEKIKIDYQSVIDVVHCIKDKELRQIKWEYIYNYVPEIRLKEGVSYTEKSVEYKLLEIAQSAEDKQVVSDRISIREKIVIEDSLGVSKSLKDVNMNNKISLKTIEEDILTVSSVLGQGYANKSGLLDGIIKQFELLGLKLKQFLGVEKPMKLATIHSLLPKQITKSHELAFLYAYAHESENIELLNGFKFQKIGSSSNLFIKDGVRYTRNYNFIKDDFIFDSAFQELENILIPNANSYRIQDKIVLIKNPFFEEEVFHVPSIKASLSIEQRKEFMSYLIKSWVQNPIPNKKDKRLQVHGIKWEEILGFSPRIKIYITSDNDKRYLLPDESLDDWFLALFSGIPQKQMIFFNLNIKNWNSYVYLTRKHFDGVLLQDFETKSKSINHGRMLKWLHSKNIITDNQADLGRIFALSSTKDYVPIVSNVTDFGEVSFKIHLKENDDTFYKYKSEKWEEFRTSIKEVFDVLSSSKKGLLVCHDILPNFECSSVSDYLGLTLEDMTAYKVEGNEYNATFYKEWSNEHGFKIYFCKKITHRVFFDKTIEVKSIEFGNSIIVGNDIFILEEKKNMIPLVLDQLSSDESQLKQEHVQDFVNKREKSKNSRHSRGHHSPELKKIGNWGEKYVYNILLKRFENNTDNVEWKNKVYIENGFGGIQDSGEPYDFKITTNEGESIYIDVKTTSRGLYDEPIYLSENEWKFMLENKENYHIYRVYNADLNQVPEGNTNASLKVFDTFYREEALEQFEKGFIVPQTNDDGVIEFRLEEHKLKI